MGYYEHVDKISDKQIEDCLGEKFVDAAKAIGVTSRECLLRIMPDGLLPLHKSEVAYGNKLAKEITEKLKKEKK